MEYTAREIKLVNEIIKLNKVILTMSLGLREISNLATKTIEQATEQIENMESFADELRRS